MAPPGSTPETADKTMLRVEEIRTVDHFQRLNAQWSELQRLTGARSIFQSHPWLLLCARHLLPHQCLLVLLVRDGERLVGAAPLMEQRAKVRGLPVRQVGFLQNPLTPFSDFLLLHPPTGLRAILTHLWEAHPVWDVLWLSQLRKDSQLVELICNLLQEQGQTFQKHVVSRTPYLPIRQSWEEFYQSKSQKFKKTRRSIANRVARLGQVTVELIHRPEDAARGVGQMLAVSERGWKRREHADLLSPDLERAFLSDLARVASENGWLRLWLLKKGEEVLAAEFHLDDHGTAYGLRAQFDDAYAYCSPGSYLDFQIVQRFFRSGCVCYDMGPGTAEYKLAWTDLTRVNYGIEVFNRGFYARMLNALQNSLIPALKATPFGQWLRREGIRSRTSAGRDE